MPHIRYEHVQHFQAILSDILDHLWGYPTHPGGFLVFEETNSSLYFREGGNLILWKVLNSIALKCVHSCAHVRLHKPVALQNSCQVLLQMSALMHGTATTLATINPCYANLPDNQRSATESDSSLSLNTLSYGPRSVILSVYSPCTEHSEATAVALQYARMSALTKFSGDLRSTVSLRYHLQGRTFEDTRLCMLL